MLFYYTLLSASTFRRNVIEEHPTIGFQQTRLSSVMRLQLHCSRPFNGLFVYVTSCDSRFISHEEGVWR